MSERKPNYTPVPFRDVVVLDLSADRSVPAAPYTVAKGPPAVVLDLSAPRPVLAFEVAVASGTSPEAVRDRVLALMTALNDLELSLGGSGIDLEFASEPGRVKCAVVPRQSAGAETRLNRLKAEIKQAMPEVVV